MIQHGKPRTIEAARPWPSLSLALQPLLPQLLHELGRDAALRLRG